MIGQTISNYKILEKLGEGGMGIVYKAQDLKLDRTVALKFLSPLLTADEVERKRFEHEAKAISALDHPNICTFYELGKTDRGHLFIAMAYYEGETVREKLKDRPLPLHEALDIAIAVAQGLSKAHEKGITHRDMKSENVIITKESGVKIMDFGLAKIAGASTMTKSGSTLGTVPYMSPEQVRGEKADHRSDIWSFGAVLYEMVTGQMPFKSEYHDAVVYLILNENPQPVTALRTGVPMGVEQIINKCLEKNAADRYQHMDEIIVDLRRERKQSDSSRTATGHSSTIAASKITATKKRMSNYLVASVVIIVAAALILVFDPFGFQLGSEKNAVLEKNSNTLAVMYFENIPDPDDKDRLGEMLTSLMTTSLSQTQGLEVISRERLYDIQAELVRKDVKKISKEMMSKIAQRVGAATVLTGTVVETEPEIAVTTQLVEVKSGRIMSARRITGFQRQRILALVDSLTSLVQNDLRQLTGSLTEGSPITKVTTTSPEAYRAYVEGVDLNKRFLRMEANAALKRAIQLDTNFAMAYYQLSYRGGDKEALRKAWQLRGNATEPQRLQIEAVYYNSIEQDMGKSTAALEMLLQKYPHYQDAYLELMLGYYQLFEYGKAIQTALKGLQNDPLDKNLPNTAAYLFAYMNQKKEALDLIDRYTKLSQQGEMNPYDSRGEIHFMFGDVDSAVYWMKMSNSLRPSWSGNALAFISMVRQDYNSAEIYFHRLRTGEPYDLWEADHGPALILLHQGKLMGARKELIRTISSHEGGRLAQFAPRDFAYLMYISYELGDYTAMVQYAQKVSKEAVSRALLKRGDLSGCDSLIGQLRDESKRQSPWGQLSFDYLEAWVSFEKKEYENSLRQFRKGFAPQPPIRKPDYFYSLALLKSGQGSEAILELERATWWVPLISWTQPRVGTSPYWPIAAVKAHYWLGVAYEQQGNKQKAIKEYGTFLDIWKNADFKSVELEDAKARLAKLKGIAEK